MIRWEYKTIVFTRDNLSYFKRVGNEKPVEVDIPSGNLLDDDDLNGLGKDGWELYMVMRNNDSESFYKEYYFKKQLD